MPHKQQIVKFSYYPKFITIDWVHMIRAFAIIRPRGGATIFHQPGGPGTPGLGAAIDANDIIEFSLQVDPVTNTAELILTTNYEAISLGVTDDPIEAQKWVAQANKIVAKGRFYRANKERFAKWFGWLKF